MKLVLLILDTNKRYGSAEKRIFVSRFIKQGLAKGLEIWRPERKLGILMKLSFREGKRHNLRSEGRKRENWDAVQSGSFACLLQGHTSA
jgi:hypothetical protein